MTDENRLHRWDVTPEEAVQIQTRLRGQVQATNGFDPNALTTIAGIDVSLKDEGQAAVVVLSYPDLALLDRVTATRKLTFPYVPGLLSFREAPVVLAAMDKLRLRPDLLLVDGQGYAHPRRFGIACHIGLILDLPAIGCAKSVLVGRYADLGPEKGDTAALTDRAETIGMALRTKPHTNPIFVSIGHKIDLPTAVAITLACVRGYRLPEPTRAAHNSAGSAGQTSMAAYPPPNPAQGTLF